MKPSAIVDAVKPLTSDAFELDAPSDRALVTKELGSVTWDTIKKANTNAVSVTTSVYLVTVGVLGSDISWSTSNPAVIALDGTIQRPGVTESDAEVTLTATITRGEYTDTKQFVVTVNDPIVKIVIGNNEMSVVGRPMTIETNLQSRPVTLIMPLGDVNLSEEELQDLAIYIEHSDGTKELIRGKLVAFNESGELGLEFSVDKFSTFTLVHGAGLADALGEASEHLSYIKGYGDDTFRRQ